MIPIKTQAEIQRMQEGGKRLAGVMEKVLGQVKPGVKLSELDNLAESLIKKQGGRPSFQMVPGYRWATCININEGVVHGIPNDYQIKQGDVVSVDMGIFFAGLHTDMARTIITKELNNQRTENPSSQKTKEKEKKDEFLEVGRRALKKAIETAVVGNRVGQISQVIEREIKKSGFSPIKSLTGHGVGEQLHEDPPIPCFLRGSIEKTPELRAGMALAIEVIYTQGKPAVVLEDDGWTVKTQDKSLAGLFEDTLVVSRKGPGVLTKI